MVLQVLDLAVYQNIAKVSSDYNQQQKDNTIHSKIGTSISQEVKLRDIK